MEIFLGITVVPHKLGTEPVNRCYQSVVDAVRTFGVIPHHDIDALCVNLSAAAASQQEVLMVDHTTDGTEALVTGSNAPMIVDFAEVSWEKGIIGMGKGADEGGEVCVGEY